ncbi:hypothetical protein IPM62_03785 [Candidatus Woesebacteria bacterium]|nr:MAG: hypothetical protein IPM62_03785 [Candidatus Woesebacteria bacterium]
MAINTKRKRFINYGTIILFTSLTVFLYIREKNFTRDSQPLPEISRKEIVTSKKTCCDSKPVTLFLGTVTSDPDNRPEFINESIKLASMMSENKIYLKGVWEYSDYFVASLDTGGALSLRYTGKRVLIDAESDVGNTLTIKKDGEDVVVAQKLTNGREVPTMILKRNYYELVNDEEAGMHTLDISTDKKGLRIYLLKVD